MGSFLNKHSVTLTVFVLVLFSCQLMSLSLRNPELPRMGARLVGAVLAPVQQVHHVSFNAVRHYWNRYLWLVEVGAERDELLNRVSALEAQNSRLIEYEDENRRLRELLAFPETDSFQRVAASIIGRDPSNWIRTVTINRGSSDSLQEGLAVVDGNAVVGQIIAVSRHSAQVLLLTDQNSAIDAIVQSSRTPGIVEGTASDTLRLKYIEKDEAVSTGDRIIASGEDGVYPKGVLIGIVTQVGQGKDGLFREVELVSSSDLSRLENVLILVPKKVVTEDSGNR